MTSIFKKNAKFFVEICQKSQKLEIITSTPCPVADYDSEGGISQDVERQVHAAQPLRRRPGPRLPPDGPRPGALIFKN
jgi:hypothetical protein